MSTMTYAGAAVEVDGEGFLQNPAEWTKEIAEAIAIENGIPALTEHDEVSQNALLLLPEVLGVFPPELDTAGGN